ncbi:hypothetical protein [Halorientalis sp. IM1011]|uniref:hypothetical protein n=1 Tax=Halorientalis sp. IM1011 TaxID=1932360 RepID=UPI0012F97AB0|nr:hypothetical protein [Halorientalis sp. IM1011]
MTTDDAPSPFAVLFVLLVSMIGGGALFGMAGAMLGTVVGIALFFITHREIEEHDD